MRQRRARGFRTISAIAIIDEAELNESMLPLYGCYFRDNADHMRHPQGHCMLCDWREQMKGLRWYSGDFIEYWDYAPYWNRNLRLPWIPKETEHY